MFRRVLFILPYPIHPPDSGPKHHAHGLLHYMSQRCECHVVGFWRTSSESEQWALLEDALPNTHVVNTVSCRGGPKRTLARISRAVSVQPVSFVAYDNSRLRLWLQEHVQIAGYDLVHFGSFNVSMYRADCAHLPTVLLPYDAFSMRAKRALEITQNPVCKLRYLWKWWAYSRFERREYRFFTKVCPVSDVDTSWLQSLDPKMDLQTVGIPIGEEFLGELVDHLEDFHPVHIVCCGSLQEDVVSLGMIEFLTEIYPLIRANNPQAHVSVWGRNPTVRLHRVLRDLPEVEHVPFVADYKDYLRSVRVYVFPQRSGSGIQTKVQQAMALGIPVVTRPHVLGALGATSGLHGYAFGDNASFAHAVNRLASDVGIRMRIGLAGARFIRHNYSLDRVGASLTRVYRDAIVKHASGAR